MEYFDPWRGANEGAKTLAALGNQIDQDKQQERAQKLADIQLQSQQLALDETKRQRAIDAGARGAVAASQQDPAVMVASTDPSIPAPKKPNSDRILIDYYRKNDPTKAAALEKLMMDKYTALAAIDPQHAVDWYNDVSGQNLTYQGQKGEYTTVKAEDGTVIAVNTKNPADVKVVYKPVAEPDTENPSGFQSAIAGLTGPSKAGSLYSLGNTAIKTGYAPLSEVEKDIRLAGADYGVKGEEINKAVDDARNLYKESYVQGQRIKPKGSKSSYTPEYNLLGQQKDVGKTTDVNVTVNQGGGARGTSNGTTGTPNEVRSWTNKIRKGDAILSEIPARGNIRTQVVTDLETNFPEVNLTEVKANKKWKESPTSMQTLALVDATKGVIQDMRRAYAKLDRTSIPAVNAAQDLWQKWSGNPDRSEYMSLKNYGIQEVEKMLSGSGAMSDHRIKLAFDNLKETNTPDQFERAVVGIQRVMAERERATRQGPYPTAATKPAASQKRPLPKF